MERVFVAANDTDGKPASPAVSVIVLAYESGALLTECLASLERQTVPDVEVILADNASTDGAPEAAAAAHPSVRLLENGANLGFAAGINRGVAAASGRWVAFLNPDAFAEPDWLERLLAAAAANPEVRCFTSRQLMAEDPTVLDGLGDVMSVTGFPYRGGYLLPDPGTAVLGEVFSACGGAMMIERALFLEMGGFDERLFCYCEDVDLGYRLRLRGEPTLVVPDAVVRHVGGLSSGGPRSDFAVFHGTRNRFWVFVKDTPPLLFWLTLPLHLFTTAVLFWRHQVHGELAAPWRGFKAGVKGIGTALEARREAQAQRKVGSLAILRAMTLSPQDLRGRRVVIRPWRPTRPAGS
jgi:N-acetylglucosaminyl-diphospho-decaprenol L-rhamnosyltransferase